MDTPGFWLTAGGMVLGAVVWLVRLEGRVNLSEALIRSLKDDLSEIKADLKALLKQ